MRYPRTQKIYGAGEKVENQVIRHVTISHNDKVNTPKSSCKVKKPKSLFINWQVKSKGLATHGNFVLYEAGSSSDPLRGEQVARPTFESTTFVTSPLLQCEGRAIGHCVDHRGSEGVRGVSLPVVGTALAVQLPLHWSNYFRPIRGTRRSNLRRITLKKCEAVPRRART